MSTGPISEVRKVLKANPVARVVVLIVILFGATMGSVGAMRIALHTDSPLMVVSSGSMIPTLNVGDIIIVRGTDPSTVTIGTIIIFHSPYDYSTPIVHRVIAIDNAGGQIFFQTKGDNNGVADGWKVPGANLIGVYIAKIPYIGLLSLELRGPLGWILIILLVLLIIAMEYEESKKPPEKEAISEARKWVRAELPTVELQWDAKTESVSEVNGDYEVTGSARAEDQLIEYKVRVSKKREIRESKSVIRKRSVRETPA